MTAIFHALLSGVIRFLVGTDIGKVLHTAIHLFPLIPLSMAPFLTSKATSQRMKAKIYDTCARSSMLYGSEECAATTDSLNRRQVTEMRMIRWMCAASLRDRVSNDELRGRLRLEKIGDVLRRRKLRCFGHVMRMDNSG